LHLVSFVFFSFVVPFAIRFFSPAGGFAIEVHLDDLLLLPSRTLRTQLHPARCLYRARMASETTFNKCNGYIEPIALGDRPHSDASKQGRELSSSFRPS